MPRRPRYRFFNRKGTLEVRDRNYNYIGIIANYRSEDGKIKKGAFTDKWRPFKFWKK